MASGESEVVAPRLAVIKCNRRRYFWHPLDGTKKTLTDRLIVFFPGTKGSRSPYSDAEIYEISSLLKHLKPSWSTVPRTHIVLRTIGCLNLLDEFIDLGFPDLLVSRQSKECPEYSQSKAPLGICEFSESSVNEVYGSGKE